ncbi:MAG: TetR/AcrR family transcriptional regulator [Pseudomonadota bacterium]
MSKRPGANKANLEETHKVFLEIALKEFCEHGYMQASTSRIVEKSGMARGSLYYHFGDKNGLFVAVYQYVVSKALEEINTLISSIKDPWEAYKVGTLKYMDFCMDNEFRKITLIESQAAMSIKDRFKIQEKALQGKLRDVLVPLVAQGHFPGHTVDTAAVFTFGILSEVGRYFDFTDDLEKARKEFGQAYEETLDLQYNKNAA